MNDHREHLRALHAAYVETSGVPVSLSPLRTYALREMDRRGLTPADVIAVISRIKWHLAKGTTGYTEASLDWRNAMQNVDTFEERALKLRQEKARKATAKKPEAPRAQTLPDGNTVLGAAPAEPAADAERIAAQVREQAEEFRRKMKGGQG